MIRIEDLHEVKMALLSNKELKKKFIDFAHIILDNKEYNQWLENGQYTDELFKIPKTLFVKNEDIKRIFDQFLLIENEILQVKLDLHEGKIHLTDGLWIPSTFRVFPFTDESERLMEYIKANNLWNWADVLIDPATGCGHHLNALGHITHKIAFDINIRAVAYCDLNRVINETSNSIVGVNDIAEGLPLSLCKYLGGKILFVINMPFALSPSKNALPLSADAGATGANHTFAALRAVKNFSLKNVNASNIKLCILNYSVGKINLEKWETVEFANNLFGKSNVKFHLLKEEKMWRVNGKKEQDNPMPIEKINLKAECRFYVNDSRRDEVRQGYKLLEKKLYEAEWDVLGYGIIEVNIR